MSFEDDLDRDLHELFKSAGPLEPSCEFVDRTVTAASRVSLPEGRQEFTRRSYSRWWLPLAAVGVALGSILFLGSEAFVASAVTVFFRTVFRAGSWLTRGLELWLAFTSVSSTVGLAVARGLATVEGLSVLVGTTLTSALALSALHRLFKDEGEKSRWQEL